MGKFEIFRDKSGEFRFRLLSNTGDNIIASESYREKRSAFNGIASIKKNCLLPERFVRKNTVEGRPYFVLKAGNHEIIGKSGNFDSAAACEDGIRDFVATAKAAEVNDLTKRSRKNKPDQHLRAPMQRLAMTD